MAALAQVSPHQVAEAAATLTAQGRRVTGNSLRGLIGQGRPERLAAVWAEQQEEQPVLVPEEPAGPTLPPTIADHLAAAMERQAVDLRGLVAQAWARASDLATSRVQAEVDAARVRVAELEDDNVQGTKNLESADERAAALADELAQTQTNAAQARAETTRVQQAAREQAAADAARLADVERTVAELRNQVAEAALCAQEAGRESSAAKAGAAAAGARATAAEAAVTEARNEQHAAQANTREARTQEQAAREARARADALAEAAVARADAADARAAAAEERASAASREAMNRLAAALAVSQVEKEEGAPEAGPGRQLATAS